MDSWLFLVASLESSVLSLLEFVFLTDDWRLVTSDCCLVLQTTALTKLPKQSPRQARTTRVKIIIIMLARLPVTSN
ncbi:hypothetical protein A3F65_02920 [Candidatus Saccharibacteria bacterium RIFCSPHIGHO2_12_FULL_47_16b]|nr:MAG: hypothetical protein A3F65_02920 [Candidatus Saccharibacteria bacterium RIFCSPHIGHO2_12_FULL_47_16b]